MTDWDLSPDEIAAALQPTEGSPSEVRVLCGFLGGCDKEGYHRLFTDPGLTRWIDIPEKAIRYRRRIPEEEGGYGERSALWVDNDVPLVKGEVTTAGAEAEFLCGSWSSEQPGEPDEEDIKTALLVVNFAAAHVRTRQTSIKASRWNCCRA